MNKKPKNINIQNNGMNKDRKNIIYVRPNIKKLILIILIVIFFIGFILYKTITVTAETYQDGLSDFLTTWSGVHTAYSFNQTNANTGTDTTHDANSSSYSQSDTDVFSNYGLDTNCNPDQSGDMDVYIITDSCMMLYIPEDLATDEYALFHNGGGTHGQMGQIRSESNGETVSLGITHNANGTNQDYTTVEITERGWVCLGFQFEDNSGNMAIWVNGENKKEVSRTYDLAYGSGNPRIGDGNADGIPNWTAREEITGTGLLIANFVADNPDNDNSSPAGNGDTFYTDYYDAHSVAEEEGQQQSGEMGLVGYWNFDDNDLNGNILYDKSGNGNNGTNNGATTSADGVLKQAFEFNGTSNYVSGNNLISLDSGTLCAWVKDNSGYSGDTPHVASTHHKYGWVFGMRYGNVWSSYDDDDSTERSLYGDTVINNDKWNFICATIDDNLGIFSIYANGVFDTSTSTTVGKGIKEISTDRWTIGCYDGDTYHNCWEGFIDEVRIYNRALSAEEVKNLYDSSKREYVTAVNGTGLGGYWKMNDNANNSIVADSSGNNNTGTFYDSNGDPDTNTHDITGKVGGALSFDGVDDYIEIPHDPSIDGGSGSFTFGLWLYASSSVGTYDMPIWKGGSSPDTAGYDMELGTGGWCSYMADGVNYKQSYFSYSPLNNQWVHLVAVLDRDNEYIYTYTNGELFDYVELGILGSINNNADNLFLGSLAKYGPNYQFNGYIDEVFIYNRALSANEVKNLYDSSKRKYITAVSEEGLVGYWNFDDNDLNGNTLYDKSGNSNNGTNNGATTGATGILKQAFEFNGTSDYVEVNHNSSIDISSGSFTYGLWIYALSSIGGYDMPIFKGGSHASNPGYDMELGLEWWGANISDGSVSKAVDISDTPLNNQWVNIVVVIDRTAQKLYSYVNGVGVSSGTDISTVGSIDSSVYNLYFGKYSSSPFNGKIDEVRIYNRALSADEIFNNYQATKRNYIQ